MFYFDGFDDGDLFLIYIEVVIIFYIGGSFISSYVGFSFSIGNDSVLLLFLLINLFIFFLINYF